MKTYENVQHSTPRPKKSHILAMRDSVEVSHPHQYTRTASGAIRKIGKPVK